MNIKDDQESIQGQLDFINICTKNHQSSRKYGTPSFYIECFDHHRWCCGLHEEEVPAIASGRFDLWWAVRYFWLPIALEQGLWS